MFIFGTMASFFPSSFMTDVRALSDYGLMEDPYNSKYLQYNKENIDCTNFNLNANGLNVDGIPESLSGLLADAAQAGEAEIGNWEKRFGLDKEFLFKCLNNNDNEQSISLTQTPPSPPPIPPLLINKDWFVCNNEDTDCTIDIPGQQISFQGPNSGMYTECTSEQDCPFANDAGFIIEITGNSPTPNTIPAQINTMQEVEIGAGPFEVSEEVFSNEVVPDAIFDVEDVPVGQDIAFTSLVLIIAFDENGQRVFTANIGSSSVSIIDLANANTVTNVPLAPSGGNGPRAIAFDETGQRVFTVNQFSSSVSIIDLANANTVTNVPVGFAPLAIAFDETGQRVFTANIGSSSVSIIDLANANTVTNVPLAPSGGNGPIAITFDETGQRVFTANVNSDSVSIIELNNANNVIDVDLSLSGGDGPVAITFDEAGQRVFTANANSDSVSIIDLLSATVSKICQDSGFDTGDIRTFVSNGQTIQQITCVNFVGECSGEIEDGETRECTVQDYVVAVNDVSNGGIGILANIYNKPEQQQQLITNDISTTKDTTTIKSIIQQKLQQKQIEQQNIQTNNIIQPKDITTKDTAIKNIIEQKEEQNLAEEQKIQKSIVMSPPSLP